jgi:3,4-dihydroxy 2-butanone 4-phosphate synthase
MNDIDRAINDLKVGRPILIFDSESREGETDITVASQFVTYEIIKLMRKDGGGLICTTLPYSVSQKLGMPYLVDLFKNSNLEIFRLLSPTDIPYDTKSSFSLTINHRKTFTGIPDKDRALTISEFSKIVNLAIEDGVSALSQFGNNFRSPGHVHLLIASKNLLKERLGHTELSLALAEMAGVIPSTTIVEMMGEDGCSLKKAEAIKYGKLHNFTFVEGKDIVKRWTNWSE